jgi:hypothetical protein
MTTRLFSCSSAVRDSPSSRCVSVAVILAGASADIVLGHVDEEFRRRVDDRQLPQLDADVRESSHHSLLTGGADWSPA